MPQLVKESLYGEELPEIRGHTDHRLYYEACAAFLNDGESLDSGEVYWKKIFTKIQN